MKRIYPLILTSLSILFITSSLFSDTIYLSDGQILVGKIIEENEEEITIQTKYQTKKVPVKFILKKQTSSETAEPVRIITKDRKIIRGFLLYQNPEKIIYKIDKDSTDEITILKSDVENILIGSVPSDRVTVLTSDKDILSGDLIYNDDEKIILKRKTPNPDTSITGVAEIEREEVILKKNISRISYGSMNLFYPSISISAGGFFPLNTGKSDLSPSFTGTLALGMGIPLIDELRGYIEGGYSRNSGSEYEKSVFQRIPVYLKLFYPVHFTYFDLTAALGGGASLMFYTDSENNKFFGLKPVILAGPGLNYELIKKELFITSFLGYELTIDNGEVLHSIILTLGAEYRI